MGITRVVTKQVNQLQISTLKLQLIARNLTIPNDLQSDSSKYSKLDNS